MTLHQQTVLILAKLYRATRNGIWLVYTATSTVNLSIWMVSLNTPVSAWPNGAIIMASTLAAMQKCATVFMVPHFIRLAGRVLRMLRYRVQHA